MGAQDPQVLKACDLFFLLVHGSELLSGPLLHGLLAFEARDHGHVGHIMLTLRLVLHFGFAFLSAAFDFCVDVGGVLALQN